MFIKAGGLLILALFLVLVLAPATPADDDEPLQDAGNGHLPVLLTGAQTDAPVMALAPATVGIEPASPQERPLSEAPSAVTAPGDGRVGAQVAATPTATAPVTARVVSPVAAGSRAPTVAAAAEASAVERPPSRRPAETQREAPVASPTPRAGRPSGSAGSAPAPSPAHAAPVRTPVIGTSDSGTGSALHCDVDSGAPLSPSERAAVLSSCPGGSPSVCGTSLAARINETPAGGVLNLSGCSYTSNAISINKAITIIGPTVSFPTGNSWGDGVWLNANNITLDRWTFLSAGLPIGLTSVQNIQILNSKFQGYTGGPIGMWGEVRNVLIEGNVIKNTRNVQSGFVGGRGNEGVNPCPQVGRYLTIRNNIGDQNTNGWFGIELKCFEDVLIERNSLKGGQVLISLPDSNRVTIRDNNLDLRGTAYWGVEVAKAHDVRMENNIVRGDGTHTDAAFSANSGSLRSIVYRNVVADLSTLFAGPIQADVRWNCLTNVAFVTQFGVPETSTISHNGPC